MNVPEVPIYLSVIDEQRFGIKTAKAFDLQLHDVENALEFCRQNGVKLFIARCLTNDIDLVQKLESEGFLLMDTLLYYSCDLKKNPPPEYMSDIAVRPFMTGEENIIKSISAEAFMDYSGHYHADRRLPKVKCDEVYTGWAYRSCFSKEVADEVFVAQYGGQIIGFGTIRANSPGEGQIIIAGILREYQGLGAYRLIFINCMRWCMERGIQSVVSSTQITNLASQKVWTRLGFEPIHSYYTFHKWFDEYDEGTGR